MNNNVLNFRTDMADERVDEYKKVNNLSQIDGIIVNTIDEDNIKVTTVDVVNANGENAIGKKIGKYITMDTQDVQYLAEDQKQKLITKIVQQIQVLISDDKKSIMIVGLGNVYVTPDALGPKVVKFLNITRHLFRYAKQYVGSDTKETSAIAPGVLGTTGIETSEIIESIVNNVKPSVVIIIDSLASQSVQRVGNSIQLSNRGIVPGSGVENTRAGISEETLNIPVIALGVPTVVDMATITNEALGKALEGGEQEIQEFNNQVTNPNSKLLRLFDTNSRYRMIANSLDTENYIVTPKEIDQIIDKMAEVVASSINSITKSII